MTAIDFDFSEIHEPTINETPPAKRGGVRGEESHAPGRSLIDLLSEVWI
jgi:hypothetical protein